MQTRKYGSMRRLVMGLGMSVCVSLGEGGVMSLGTEASAAVDSAPQDPALTIGTLPNGMRYYIRESTVPAKRARIWLAVNAGTIQEDDDQQGFAHFLEHMAFNGTTHFPKNTLIDFIEQAGMQFGGDLNAYTSFDETVYMLTVPTDDQTVLTQGLRIVEDWASGEITMDSVDVVEERGVVLGEWRARNPDTADQRVQTLYFQRVFGDSSRYLKRFPIGLPALLKTASPEPIRRFYRDWYRPDLMAIIVVGDFDKAAMEREIVARFGRIPAATNARQFVRPPGPDRGMPVVHVVKDNVNPSVQINWTAPPLPSAPEANVRQQVLEALLFQHLQRQFLKLSRQERRPFAAANAKRSRGIIRPLGEMYALELVASPDSLESGLIAVLQEIERIAQYGIPATELEPRKAALLRRMEHAADASSATPSQQLAQAYVQHYLQGEGLLLNPRQELVLLKQILPTVTPQTMAKAAQFWRTSGPPNVIISLPQFAHIRTPTRDIVLALLDSVAKTPIPSPKEQPAAKGATASLLTSLPIPGKVVQEQHFAKSGVTAWTLSNGIRVLYKHSAIQSDELIVQAGSPGGTSRLADSLFFTPGRYVGALMTSAGGLGTLGREALVQELNTTALQELRVSINAFDEEIVVGGSPKEMETLFQLMYLQFTAPKVDTTALTEWRRYGGWTLEMSPNDKLASALAPGEPRLTPVSHNMVNLISLIDPTQAMTVYRDRFGDPGDFTFTIVGAASREQIKPLVERYLASLPVAHLAEREQPRDLKIKPLKSRQDLRVESSRVPPEKAQNTLLFDGRLPVTPREAMRERQLLTTLSWILGNRLRNRLREEMAVTYNVSAPVSFYRNPQPHYQLKVHVLTAPDRIDESVKNIWQIIDAIRTSGVTAEEIARAATVTRRSTENAMQNNRWWIAQLQYADQAELSFDDVVVVDRPSVTSADVQAAAQRYLSRDIYLQETVLPTKKKIAEYEKESEVKDSLNGQ